LGSGESAISVPKFRFSLLARTVGDTAAQTREAREVWRCGQRLGALTTIFVNVPRTGTATISPLLSDRCPRTVVPLYTG
jgi:hypothetical protein